jgi:hypothetical protein
MIQHSRLYRRLGLAAVAVAVAAGVVATVSTVAARTARRETAQRPVILFLHGRGQLGRDTAAIRTEFLRSLETGVAKLARHPLLDSSDVRLVWYADVLDPASSVGCDSDTRTRSQSSGEEGEVLQLLLGITSTLFTSLYESMPEDDRHSMRSLVGDVMYLGDRWRRCAVERRIESALMHAAREKRPVILVAHSFGSLVAYSYLRADRARTTTVTPPSIHRYVTLGSMLGIPELQELVLGRAGPLSLPAGVRSWVNVRHTRDPFAAPLVDTTGSRPGSVKIREVVTSANAVDPHDIVTYLRDPAAARAIAWAWCDAGGKGFARGCDDIRSDIP